jgi:hypothetical protein
LEVTRTRLARRRSLGWQAVPKNRTGRPSLLVLTSEQPNLPHCKSALGRSLKLRLAVAVDGAARLYNRELDRHAEATLRDPSGKLREKAEVHD